MNEKKWSHACAIASKLAYVITTVNGELEGALLLRSLLPGWELAHQSYKRNNDGYHGVCIVNKSEKRAIIAHRGTDNIKNGIDNTYIWREIAPTAYRAAKSFSDESIAILQSPADFNLDNETVFIQTGHSSGGVQAQLIAFDTADHICKAITFDNPGCYNILLNQGRSDVEINAFGERTLSYLSGPNPVNVLGKHIGECVRIYVDHANESSIATTSLVNFIKHPAWWVIDRHYSYFICKSRNLI